MKMSKKWFSVILVMALSMGLIAPVSAEPITGSKEKTTTATITIKDGALEIDSATESINFGEINFSFAAADALTATSDQPIELQITDNRYFADSHSWELQAKLEGFDGLGDVKIEATGGKGNNVSIFERETLVLKVGETGVSVSKVNRTEGTEGETDGQGTSTITYDAPNITVTVPRESLNQAETQQFSGSILWTLSNTATGTE